MAPGSGPPPPIPPLLCCPQVPEYVFNRTSASGEKQSFRLSVMFISGGMNAADGGVGLRAVNEEFFRRYVYDNWDPGRSAPGLSPVPDFVFVNVRTGRGSLFWCYASGLLP